MQGSIPIQQVVIIILHFRGVCQVYFSYTSCAVYIPQAKAWGFDGKSVKSFFPSPTNTQLTRFVVRGPCASQRCPASKDF